MGLILWAILAGPAPEAVDVPAALRAAENLEAARAFAAARQMLADVVPLAGEQAPQLQLRICHLWRREGSEAAAESCYARLAGELSPPEARATARYHAGTVAYARGDEQAGRDRLFALLRDQPDSHGAERALIYLRAERRERAGACGEADLLLGVASQLERAGVGAGSRRLAQALVEAGRLRLEGCPRAPSAANILARARAAAAGTVWADDALYWSALAARANGRYAEAVDDLRALVEARESSLIVGTYDSTWLDDARYELAVTLERAGDGEAALAAYRQLVADAPDSRFVDDAAFAVARLAAAGGERSALSDFLREHPGSRHARRARELLASP